MKAHNFCYWLQGYFELTGLNQQELTVSQIKTIKKHLEMVFIHDIDKKYPNQEELNKIHNGGNNAPRC